MNRLRFEKLWLTLGFGFVALVFYLSLAPDLPDTGVPNGMKIGHVLAYGWLMFWFAQIYRSNAMRYAFALVFCAMGIGLEYAQGTTDYRGFEYSDMLINSGGVGLGLLLSYTRLQNTFSWLESLVLRRVA
jgi:VanZ family protein